VTEVLARCHNGEPYPLNSAVVAGLVGQTAPIAGPGGDFARYRGRVYVKSASLEGDSIIMTLDATDGVLGPGDIKQVGIGFSRQPNGLLHLHSVYHDPGAPAVPAELPPPVTDEQRRKGAEMLKSCAYETAVHLPCRRTATSMVRVRANSWHYRCAFHEAYNGTPGAVAEIRPIPLVPFPSDVKEPTAEWIVDTPWWRLAADAADPQSRDFGGRDLFDVLVEVVGSSRAEQLWDEASALADAAAGNAPVTSAAITGSRITPIASKYDTEWECESHGGHCFERTGMTKPSSPPQHEEACKHCPAKRLAIPREPFHYRYPDGRTGG
jgi:hypothetical protein